MNYRTKAALVVIGVPLVLAGGFALYGLASDTRQEMVTKLRASKAAVPPGVIREYSPKREAWLKEHFPVPSKPLVCPPCECRCVAPLPAEAP